MHIDIKERERGGGERDNLMMNSGLPRPSRLRSKTERKRKERSVTKPCLRIKTTMEYESDGDTNGSCCTFNPKALVTGLEDLEIRGHVEIILATTLLRSARILGRVPET